MKRIFITGFAIIIFFGQEGILAQGSSEGFTQRPINEFYDNFLREETSPYVVVNYKDTEGSPYLMPFFQEGKVYTKTKASYSVPLRFNLYEGNFEFKTDKGILAISHLDNVMKIELNGAVYSYFELNNKKSFVELVTSGKTYLICTRDVIFRKAQPSKGYKQAISARFIRKKDLFYIISENNESFFSEK